MKKYLLLTFSFIVIYAGAQAQISKGTVLLGGDLSFGTNKTETGTVKSKTTGFSISPSVGIAFKDNKVLGLSLYYGHTEDQPNQYGAGTFYRSYLTLGKGFYLFGQAGLGFSHYENISNPTFTLKEVYKSNSIGLSLYPGVAYTVSKRFQLEASMNNLITAGYTHSLRSSVTNVGVYESESRDFHFTTSINPESNLKVGFRFTLGK